MSCFRKKPAIWFVLRPGRPGQDWKREGPYSRKTIADMYAASELSGGALLWTNEKIFPNPKKPNSARLIRIEKWSRFDELPDPAQNDLLSLAGSPGSLPPGAPVPMQEKVSEADVPPPPPVGGYPQPGSHSQPGGYPQPDGYPTQAAGFHQAGAYTAPPQGYPHQVGQQQSQHNPPAQQPQHAQYPGAHPAYPLPANPAHQPPPPSGSYPGPM